MRIDRHVYGSVTGYQTLAKSDGVTTADLHALENFGVGQSSDPSFFRSLASQPAWIVRSIGHRRALTRVAPGRPDDANRQTTVRLSLLIPAADWDSVLRGDIGSLAGKSELWEWRGESVLPSLNASLHGPGVPVVTPDVAQKLASILSLIERAWAARRPVIVRESSLSLDEFRILGMLIPPHARAGYCAVYRTLTADHAASLTCLAAQSPVRSSAETFRAGQAVEYSPYAAALLSAGFSTGKVPLEFIQTYRSFGMPPKPAESTPPRSIPRASVIPSQVIVERMPRPLLITLILACFVLPVVSGVCTWVYSRGHYTSITVNAVVADLPLSQMSVEARKTLGDKCTSLLAGVPKWAGKQKTEALKNLLSGPAQTDRWVMFPGEQEEEAWLKGVFSTSVQNGSNRWSDATALAQKIALTAEAQQTNPGLQRVAIPKNEKIDEWLSDLAAESGKTRISLPNNTADGLVTGIRRILEQQRNDQEKKANRRIAEAQSELASAITTSVNESLDKIDSTKDDACDILNGVLDKLRTKLGNDTTGPKLGSIPEEKVKRLRTRPDPLIRTLKHYKSKLDETVKATDPKGDRELAGELQRAIDNLKKMVDALSGWKPPAIATPREPDLDRTIELLGRSAETLGSN